MTAKKNKKSPKKTAKKSAKRRAAKSPKKTAKRAASKKSTTKKTKHAHGVFTKAVGKRLAHVEKDVKTLAKVASIQGKTLKAHHELIEEHHKKIGTIGKILRGTADPKQLRA